MLGISYNIGYNKKLKVNERYGKKYLVDKFGIEWSTIITFLIIKVIDYIMQQSDRMLSPKLSTLLWWRQRLRRF